MSTFTTKILLATDGSEEATLAARTAAALAASTGSELHVLTVGPEYPFSKAAPAIVSVAEEGEEERTLLAVGSRGLSAPKRMLLGSVSTNVLRAVDGPALIVPPNAVPAGWPRNALESEGVGIQSEGESV